MFNNLIDFVGMMVIRMRHQDGQTMAEYGILIAVVAIVVIAGAALLGTSITGLFSSTSTKV